MNKLKQFPYKHVLVLGLAKSGTATAKMLIENDVAVRVNDYRTSEQDEVVQQLRAMGAEVIVGSHPLSVLEGISLIVKNPGIPYEIPILQEATQRDIPIITEIELASQLASHHHLIAITGSNGKTTTTKLVEEMLMHSNQPVKMAGNIGTVAIEVAQTLKPNESFLLELSSFQLMGIQSFKPRIAAILNLFSAHLDYHKTLENYHQAKFNIFMNQTKEDYLVYNADDRQLGQGVQNAQAKLIPFSLTTQLEEGAWQDGEYIYFNNEQIIKIKDIVLVGEHNLENILAAVSIAKLTGATIKGIQYVLTHFTGVKHRLQFVDSIDGRQFYNDSKATNILATQKALNAFKQPLILLAGGLDRGNEFSDLIPYFKHVKAVVLFGETAPKLEKTAREAGIKEIVRVDHLTEAVPQAFALSTPEDVILLSPACASWDQFRTFEERGDMFIQAVNKLK